MQPRRPQGQRAPSRLTTMWPISPAAPRPSHGLPPRMIPPPTPVPHQTPSRESERLAGTEAELAFDRDLDVVAEPDLSPQRLRQVSPSGKLPSQPGRLRAPETMPVLPSASPGEPTPTPCRASGFTPAAEAASRNASSIASRDIGGTARGRRRVARFAEDLSGGVDDRRSGSSSRRGRCPHAAGLFLAHELPIDRIGWRPYSWALWKARTVADDQTGWRIWWAKRRWYERNRRTLRRWRLARHAVRGGFFIRQPVEGEVLEALDEGRLRIGEGTLLEPGCWLTLAPEAQIEIGTGCFLNRNTMLAALELIEIGDHTMFANGCFVGDSSHRFDDPERPITHQGFTSKGPVRIGSNCWFGVNCVVTSGVTIGDRCVIGANSVVTHDLPPGTIAAGRPGLCDQVDLGAGRCL